MIVTKEFLLEVFEYRDGRLFWKKPTALRHKVGDVAGTYDKKGYCKIMLNRKSYLAHRLIYLMHHGNLPKFVDHINGDPSDNHIENLREATNTQNCMNSKVRKHNKAGVKGVHWEPEYNKWKVQVSVNGKHKNFGRYEDLELAELVAIEARNKYHGEFARHH